MSDRTSRSRRTNLRSTRPSASPMTSKRVDDPPDQGHHKRRTAQHGGGEHADDRPQWRGRSWSCPRRHAGTAGSRGSIGEPLRCLRRDKPAGPVGENMVGLDARCRRSVALGQHALSSGPVQPREHAQQIRSKRIGHERCGSTQQGDAGADPVIVGGATGLAVKQTHRDVARDRVCGLELGDIVVDGEISLPSLRDEAEPSPARAVRPSVVRKRSAARSRSQVRGA